MQRFVMKHAFLKLLVPIFIIMLALVGCDDGSSSDEIMIPTIQRILRILARLTPARGICQEK